MRQVSVERLRELLDYAPDSGVFTRKVSVNFSDLAGHVAGGFDKNGYVKFSVDHINGVVGDNRIENLRVVPRSHNLQNQRRAHKDAASGILGVKIRYGKKRTKYEATIFANGKANFLGTFLTAEEASNAYVQAKRILHPGCRI